MSRTSPRPMLPSLVTVKKHATAHEAEAVKTLALAARFAVESELDYRAAAAIAATVKRRLERIDKLRRSFTETLVVWAKSINNHFRPSTTKLEQAEDLLKTKMATFVDGFQDGELVVDGVAVRHSWGGTIVDELLIPAQYWKRTVDVEVLEALTRSRDGDPGVPGWKAERKTTIAISSSAAPPDTRR